MKKILLFIMFFFFGITFVYADPQEEYSTQQITCIYKEGNTDNYLSLEIRVQSDIVYLGNIDYYKETNNNKSLYFNYDTSNSMKYFKNYNKKIKDIDSDYTLYQYALNLAANTYPVNTDAVCPAKIYIVNYEEKNKEINDLYACKDDCSVINKYVSNLASSSNGSVHILNNYNNVDFSFSPQVGIDGPNTNVQDKYNDIQSDIERYCENGEEKNTEKCKKAQQSSSTITDNAESIGVTEEELMDNYLKITNPPEFKEANCDSLLGKITEPSDPAYYLNFAFNLLKYAGIVALLVLSIVEFAKAITSSNEEAIKKAGITSAKRIIIVVVLFFLPLLINFILGITGIVTTDPTCGIGDTGQNEKN